jgi:hypothetical protein
MHGYFRISFHIRPDSSYLPDVGDFTFQQQAKSNVTESLLNDVLVMVKTLLQSTTDAVKQLLIAASPDEIPDVADHLTRLPGIIDKYSTDDEIQGFG